MISSNATSAAAAAEITAAEAPRRITVLRSPSVSLAGVINDLRKLVQYRDLFYTLSVHRIKVRYKQSALGAAWAILQPLSLMLIYTVVFSYIARMPTGDVPYAVFTYSALLPWTFFATAISNATGSLVSHTQLVTKVYFPREILPLTYIVAALFDLIIASTILIGLLIYYRIPVTADILYVVPVIAVLTVFATAISLFFSATQVRFRDVGVGIPLLLQLWMFASPIIYPLSAVPGRFKPLYTLNPMVSIIEVFRQAVLHQGRPSLAALGLPALISLILFACSYVYFKRVESTIADVI